MTSPGKVTKAEIAKGVGISRQMLHRYERARGKPFTSVDDFTTWKAGHVNPRAAAKEPGDLNEETTRLRAAQADLAELEAAEKRRELAPVADFQIVLNEVMVIFATQQDGMAGRCASHVRALPSDAEARQYLLDEGRQIRRAAAARIADWARGAIGPDAAGAAAEQDAGRVGGSGKDAPARKR